MNISLNSAVPYLWDLDTTAGENFSTQQHGAELTQHLSSRWKVRVMPEVKQADVSCADCLSRTSSNRWQISVMKTLNIC